MRKLCLPMSTERCHHGVWSEEGYGDRQMTHHRSHSDNEDIVSSAEMRLQMQRSAQPSASYITMLTLATLIATFGLIGNSAPAIIGAMIVATIAAKAKAAARAAAEGAGAMKTQQSSSQV